MTTAPDLDVLVSDWTLLGPERELVGGKVGPGRLGFALALKGFIARGRFAGSVEEFSSEVVEFVARQLEAEPAEAAVYDWSGRTGRRHREQIRAFLGFRECSVADADRLRGWLEREVCEAERDPARVRAELAAEFVVQRIEGRVDRLVSSALHQAEVVLTERIAARLGASPAAALEGLLSGDGDAAPLGQVRAAPGKLSLSTMLAEIFKLRAVRARRQKVHRRSRVWSARWRHLRYVEHSSARNRGRLPRSGGGRRNRRRSHRLRNRSTEGVDMHDRRTARQRLGAYFGFGTVVGSERTTTNVAYWVPVIVAVVIAALANEWLLVPLLLVAFVVLRALLVLSGRRRPHR